MSKTTPERSSRPISPRDMDSSPDLSPRRMWRTSSLRPQEPTLRHHGQQRSYSSQPPRSSSQRSRRAPSPQQPPRRTSARGRSPRTRERSPLTQAPPPAPRGPVHSRLGIRAPSPPSTRASVHSRLGTPVIPASPQPGPSSGIIRPPPPLTRIYARHSSESTLTAPSPDPRATTGRPRPSATITSAPPSRPALALDLQRLRSPRPEARSPAPPVVQTPTRLDEDGFEVPRTPGYSSPELDLTRLPRPVVAEVETTEEDSNWDRYTDATVAHSPPPAPQQPLPEAPLHWHHIVDLIYSSGLVDLSALPPEPVPVQSVIGGPQAPAKKRESLPPSPLTAASLPAAMHACWGGDWTSHAQHQPPPPNAALHPGPASWVPEFKARYHAGPGLDLRPARLSAREREWAGTNQPPVEHAWLMDIESMARAQLASLSNLEWLFGVYVDSRDRASAQELDAVRGFIARELQFAVNFSGSQIAAATIARRKAILDSLQRQLNQTTRNWLQLQPVGLRTHQGLFGPASAQVPEIMRQQPVPREQPPRRRAARGPNRRGAAREPAAQAAPAEPPRRPAATYTPTAAAAPAAERPPRPRGRGGQQPSSRGAKGPKQQA